MILVCKLFPKIESDTVNIFFLRTLRSFVLYFSVNAVEMVFVTREEI